MYNDCKAWQEVPNTDELQYSTFIIDKRASERRKSIFNRDCKKQRILRKLEDMNSKKVDVMLRVFRSYNEELINSDQARTSLVYLGMAQEDIDLCTPSCEDEDEEMEKVRRIFDATGFVKHKYPTGCKGEGHDETKDCPCNPEVHETGEGFIFIHKTLEEIEREDEL